MKRQPLPVQSGQAAEQIACEFLQSKGLKLIERNYRCRRGEIDLVMQDTGELVFVEVRYRRNNHFGTPAETVNQRKQSRLIAAANHFLLTRRLSCACRFDVVAFCGTELPHAEWIKNAFEAG